MDSFGWPMAGTMRAAGARQDPSNRLPEHDPAVPEASGREGGPSVAICIASYRRPEGLARLLRSLDRLEFRGPRPSRLVLVVDNDAAGSARPVCDAARLADPLRYVSEPRQGIPQARNAALAAARDEAGWIAFLDDDEEPEPSWLDELLRVQRATGADVVTGPVLPRYEDTPPDWVLRGRFFEPDRHADGAPLDRAFTGNVLLRSALLEPAEASFDERLRVGEDVEFFERLARRGARIVWADRAIAYEHVPRARMRVGWIARRGAQIGAARSAIESTGGLRSLPRGVAHGCWCLARGAAGLLGNALLGRAAPAVSSLRLLAYGAGRLAGLTGRVR